MSDEVVRGEDVAVGPAEGPAYGPTDGRGLVPDLPSPAPLGVMLPGVFADDELLQRFVTVFDDALAPVFLTLDLLSCYVDPWLAPRDHLAWLGAWVGVELDPAWDLARCRAAVASAAVTQRRHGTVRGVADAVRAVTGGEVEVRDSGGVAASTTARAELPGEPGPSFHVRVVTDADVDERLVRDVVDDVRPAHVPYTLDLVRAP